LSLTRARGLLLFVALAAYANALGNGFAYDDNLIIALNPVVTGGDWEGAFLGGYWQQATEGSGLYRPITVASFTAEWGLWGGSPLGFHAVNIVAHALLSLLVLALLLRFTALPGALTGAVLFAVHPVHVEAVANVVGRAELFAAISVLLACLLYLDGDAWRPAKRAARLAGLSVLYLVGLGSKEIAVTLPGLLVLLEVYRPTEEPLVPRIRRGVPVVLSLAAVLGAYLILRWSVLGTVAGEVPAPALRGLTGGERVLTAITVWPEYLRLMVFPASLSADYAPGVIMVARGVTPDVLLGLAVLIAWLGGAVFFLRRAPMVGLGLAWFALTVLPVSNLVIPTGVLLAERTLYLPSVGLALVAADLARRAVTTSERRTRALAMALAAVAGLALFVRTVTRNPAWLDSYTMVNTLAMEHPESYLALQHRASGLVRVGEMEDAAAAYDAAVELAPRHYGLLTEAGGFYARLRQEERAESLLRRAIAETPGQPTAYRLLAEQLIRLDRGREGHAMALLGLARAGPDRELWALVSEAYIAKGDLEASVRARRAALTQDPGSVHDWNRLVELLQALGRDEEAREAQIRADAAAAMNPSPSGVQP
jgi:tetratricopeptide (TPR) repeat protein